ncbi:MAG TPA: hypothetical protein VEX18_01850, partial [Polyangiaceae bacterium]|nr:hypothetical protein [Polyangiaceae bacterium]
IVVRIEQDAPLSTGILIQAAADHSEIFNNSLEAGTIRYVYVTAGPATTTHFRFQSTALGTSQGFALITFTDQPEQDDHEPNNSMASAKPIALGQAVAGQLLDPWEAENIDLSQDWFAIELAQGTATFSFTKLPSAGRAAVEYFPPGGPLTSSFLSPAIGVLTATKDLTVNTAGTYYFIVRPYNESAVTGVSYNTKPAYLDEQYSFTITQ